MRRRKHRNDKSKWLLYGGAAAILYGIVIGPSLSWLIGWGGGAALYTTCIAVGLLAGVCGVVQRSGAVR